VTIVTDAAMLAGGKIGIYARLGLDDCLFRCVDAADTVALAETRRSHLKNERLRRVPARWR